MVSEIIELLYEILNFINIFCTFDTQVDIKFHNLIVKLLAMDLEFHSV